jgi:RNA polymerase sigma-70 factor, ECF subfamily
MMSTMDGPSSKIEYFLSLLSTPLQEEMKSYPDLLKSWEEAIISCTREWPNIHISLDTFLEFLAHRLNQAGDPKEPQAWKLKDLYLVCGCLAGSGEAIAAFERHVFATIELKLQSVLKSPELVADLKQGLLTDLFVGDKNNQPKAQSYIGQTNLRHWVFIVAIRRAINQYHRAKNQSQLIKSGLDNLTVLNDDPELRYLKGLYRQEFGLAFRQALASLAMRQRNLLRYYFFEELTLEQIGAIYGVTRMSVSRWLANIRHKILTHTRQCLMQRLQVSSAECESIIRILKSQMPDSIKTYLRREQEA